MSAWIQLAVLLFLGLAVLVSTCLIGLALVATLSRRPWAEVATFKVLAALYRTFFARIIGDRNPTGATPSGDPRRKRHLVN